MQADCAFMTRNFAASRMFGPGGLKGVAAKRLDALGVSAEVYFAFVRRFLYSTNFSKILPDGSVKGPWTRGRLAGLVQLTHGVLTTALWGGYRLRQHYVPTGDCHPAYLAIEVRPDDPFDHTWNRQLSQDVRLRRVVQTLGEPTVAFTDMADAHTLGENRPKSFILFYFSAEPFFLAHADRTAWAEARLAEAQINPRVDLVVLHPREDHGLLIPFGPGSQLLDPKTLQPVAGSLAENMAAAVLQAGEHVAMGSAQPAKPLKTPPRQKAARRKSRTAWRKHMPPKTFGIPLQFVREILAKGLTIPRKRRGEVVLLHDFQAEHSIFVAWRLFEWFNGSDGFIHSEAIDLIPGFSGKSSSERLAMLEKIGIQRRGRANRVTKAAYQYIAIDKVYPDVPFDAKPLLATLEEGICLLMEEAAIRKNYTRDAAKRILKHMK